MGGVSVQRATVLKRKWGGFGFKEARAGLGGAVGVGAGKGHLGLSGRILAARSCKMAEDE